MAKTLAMIFGVVFVLVGLLGFVNNPILGLFAVDALHNIVHIILGIVLIAGARNMNPKAAVSSMKTVGIIYIVLAVLGFILVPVSGKLLGLVTMNGADNWLHVVLGVALLIAAMAAKPSMKSSSMSGNAQM
jgi:hypothetical protein